MWFVLWNSGREEVQYLCFHIPRLIALPQARAQLRCNLLQRVFRLRVLKDLLYRAIHVMCCLFSERLDEIHCVPISRVSELLHSLIYLLVTPEKGHGSDVRAHEIVVI